MRWPPPALGAGGASHSRPHPCPQALITEQPTETLPGCHIAGLLGKRSPWGSPGLCPHHPSGLHAPRTWEAGVGSSGAAGPGRGGKEAWPWAELGLVLLWLRESPGSQRVEAAWGRRDSPTRGAAQSTLGSPGPVTEAAEAGGEG